MKRQILLFSVLFWSINAFSQFNFERKDSIQVIDGLDTLLNPWAGGFNNPQFSAIDLNQDGIKDVFVFDRSSNEVRTFVYEDVNGTMQLIHKPEYENQFPRSAMEYRVALVDYNCDGKEDLWTHIFGGFAVYENKSNPTDGLQWELTYPFLRSFHYTSLSQVYSRSSDIPAITDIDGDGDIDILSFSVGGQTIQYHRNMAMETNGNCDTMIFELKNECWGKIKEDGTSNLISVNDNTQPCNGDFNVSVPEKLGTRHVGGSILALDMDNSGLQDLVLGDATYPNLISLTNTGSVVNSNSPLGNMNTTFPTSHPVNVPSFPACYYLDLDNDGIKDFIASPNAKSLSNNVNSAWWYKNTGTNTSPNLVFQSEDFLQGGMIDVGTSSIPVLFDYNNDSLEDLIVSNTFNFVSIDSNQSRFSLYKNVGTQEEPIFQLENSNYINMPSQHLGLRLVPTFGDLDNDGDKDLLVGTQNGMIYFFKNTSTNGIAQFSNSPTLLENNLGEDIDVGNYAAPTLFDLNKDGKLDLVVGNKIGRLWYYSNIGSAFNPNFELRTESLGQVNVAVSNSDGYAQPNFVNVNDTIHLFLGSGDGFVHYYSGINNNLHPDSSFHLESHNYLNLKNGTYSALAIKDINKNNKLDLFLGNDLGGLAHYEGEYFENTVSIPNLSIEDIAMTIYPNPSEGLFNFQMNAESFQKLKGSLISIYSLDGKIVLRQRILSQNQSLSIRNKGMYLLKIDNIKGAKKLIVR